MRVMESSSWSCNWVGQFGEPLRMHIRGNHACMLPTTVIHLAFHSGNAASTEAGRHCDVQTRTLLLGRP